MKILILNWRDIKHPLAGGAEIATQEHAKAWVSSGHDVIMFSSEFPKGKREEIIDGVRIIRGGNHYTVHLRAAYYYLKYLRGKIDFVVDEFHFIPFFTPLYVTQKKIAYIHEVAGKNWFKNIYFPLSLIGYLIEPLFFLLYRKTRFMTVSNSTREDLIRFGLKKHMITIIYNGIAKFNSRKTQAKNPVVLYLGKLAIDKGIEDAIHAFSKVHFQRTDCIFWIVGKEEKKGYKNRLVKLVNRLGIEKSVTFYGYVSELDKFNIYKTAWVLIHSSLKEGWGLTVIEAASQGCVTVGYDTAGLRDSILDKKTGLLVDYRNINSLALSVLKIIEDKNLRETLGKNAVKMSADFSWDKSTKESTELINSL